LRRQAIQKKKTEGEYAAAQNKKSHHGCIIRCPGCGKDTIYLGARDQNFPLPGFLDRFLFCADSSFWRRGFPSKKKSCRRRGRIYYFSSFRFVFLSWSSCQAILTVPFWILIVTVVRISERFKRWTGQERASNDWFWGVFQMILYSCKKIVLFCALICANLLPLSLYNPSPHTTIPL